MALIVSEPQTRKLIDMAQAVAQLDKMFRDRAAGKPAYPVGHQPFAPSDRLDLLQGVTLEDDHGRTPSTMRAMR